MEKVSLFSVCQNYDHFDDTDATNIRVFSLFLAHYKLSLQNKHPVAIYTL